MYLQKAKLWGRQQNNQCLPWVQVFGEWNHKGSREDLERSETSLYDTVVIDT